MAKVNSFRFVEGFSCLGAECPDTCCVGWGMQVDSAREALYRQTPELADSIVTEQGAAVMRRDAGGHCVKWEGGLCGIQKKYGEDYLTDACYFFPRVARKFGDKVVVAATLSCPEIARLALREGAFERVEKTLPRLPTQIKDYLPQGMEPDQAFGVMQAFLTSDETLPERRISHIVTVSRSLDHLNAAKWAEAVPFLLGSADNRLPVPVYESTDAYYLLQALASVVAQSGKNLKLAALIAMIEQGLSASIAWDSLEIVTHDDDASGTLQAYWQYKKTPAIERLLCQWIQAQLALFAFPFTPVEVLPSERAALLAVRFATLKLALMCHTAVYKALPDMQQAVAIIQTLSRFLDHRADVALPLSMYKERGWLREGRLRAVVGCE